MINTNPPKISIIVAVFNAETTLRRCLDSLRVQTLRDIEIIIVDDGSTDSSWSICQEFENTDKRFKSFHKKNEGVSATRQFGLQKSHGQYIIYLDSDDYVLPNAYQAFYDCTSEGKTDIVYSAFRLITHSGVSTIDTKIPRCDTKKMLDDTIYYNRGFLWNHLIRRELITELEVSFPSNMQFGEDQFFLISLLNKCLVFGHSLSITFLETAYICYDKTANENSLSSLETKKRSEAKYYWWTETGKIIDNRFAGKSYYSVLVKDAFLLFWNKILTKEEFGLRYNPHYQSIKKYARFSDRKYLVLLACNGRYDLAHHFRWICTPSIIKDRIDQFLYRINNRPF